MDLSPYFPRDPTHVERQALGPPDHGRHFCSLPPWGSSSPPSFSSSLQCPRFSFHYIDLYLLVIALPSAWPILYTRITNVESNGNIFHKVTLFHILHSRKVVFYLYLAVLAGINSEIIQVGSEKQRYRNQQRSQEESQLKKKYSQTMNILGSQF